LVDRLACYWYKFAAQERGWLKREFKLKGGLKKDCAKATIITTQNFDKNF
jgi:hypothetical protein